MEIVLSHRHLYTVQYVGKCFYTVLDMKIESGKKKHSKNGINTKVKKINKNKIQIRYNKIEYIGHIGKYGLILQQKRK